MYVTTQWSPCSQACGEGVQLRSILCYVDGIQAASVTACAPIAQQLPPSQQACTIVPCAPASAIQWVSSSHWSPCSSPCVATGSTTSLGVSSRDEPRCMSAGTAVVDSVCTDLGLVKPPTFRPCNRFPCPAAQFCWRVGSWGPCTNSYQHCGIGRTQRAVWCVDYNGTAVPDGLCASAVMPQPAAETACDTGVSCNCGLYGDVVCQRAVGNRSTCIGGSVCGCSRGWTGADCTAVDVTATAAVPHCALAVDIAGDCCSGIDATTGLCCPAGVPLDSQGRCCVGGRFDGCGVCNGTGVALDISGQCCRFVLSPTGRCCEDGVALDDCGVCGGANECGITASFEFPSRDLFSITAGVCAVLPAVLLRVFLNDLMLASRLRRCSHCGAAAGHRNHAREEFRR